MPTTFWLFTHNLIIYNFYILTTLTPGTVLDSSLNMMAQGDAREGKRKYKSLCIEIKRMWNLKCAVIPVIIGTTGVVTRSLRKNLEAVPGKHSIDSLQKTATLGTSHIIRKVLQCEAWSVSGGDHRWFKRSTGKKRPMTRGIHIV